MRVPSQVYNLGQAVGPVERYAEIGENERMRI